LRLGYVCTFIETSIYTVQFRCLKQDRTVAYLYTEQTRTEARNVKSFVATSSIKKCTIFLLYRHAVMLCIKTKCQSSLNKRAVLLSSLTYDLAASLRTKLRYFQSKQFADSLRRLYSQTKELKKKTVTL
jgi:hypothetical protein